MLKKTLKLRKATEFQRLYKHGKRISTEHLRIFWRTTNLANPQIAVVVSKKISKKATDRNHLRRVVFAIMQAKIDQLSPVNLIVLLKGDVLSQNQSSLEQELQQSLEKAGLIKT